MRRTIICLVTFSLLPALAVGALSLQACGTTATRRTAADPPAVPLGSVPFELHNAHVYLRVQVDDSVFGWFILDTGGSTTLDSATATSLGRSLARTRTGIGGGEAQVTVRYMDGVQLRVIDAAAHAVATLAEQRVAVLDLSPVARGEGRPLAGILGGSFFARHAALIDYDRRMVEVYRRGDLRVPPGWIAVALRVQGDLVFARGTLTLRPGETPIPGWYMVDTGGAHSLILNTPLVSRQGLATPETASADAMLSVGGGAPARNGRVEAFGIGGVMSKDVPTLFSQARSGLFSSSDFDGSVGGGLLTRFSGVAFDYGSRRMWLGPLRRAP
jgi:hypothetical protein